MSTHSNVVSSPTPKEENETKSTQLSKEQVKLYLQMTEQPKESKKTEN